MKSSKLRILSFFIVIGVIMLAGCRKKQDTIAIIHVLNASSQIIQNAQVVLKGTSTTGQPDKVVLYDTVYTNSSGDAQFNFNDVYQLGQAGVAVLDIEVRNNGKLATGIIKVEQETTSRETIYLQ